mgnify:CR=1 FL=1
MIRKLFKWLFRCDRKACRNGCKCGKGETSITYPSAPAQPSTADAVKAWVESMPTVFAEQQRQAPLEAQQQLNLTQQYAAPIAQALYGANQAVYPVTSGLQENMAGQAQAGMNATEMPEWMRNQYRSEYNANLGTNAGSPIGAEYTSRNMQNQLFQQQKYYRDLGLSLAGRQPLTQAATPATTNYASTFTPSNVMNYMQQGYGTYAAASRPIATQSSGGGLFGFLGM